jgi:aldehyde:ferredoxin oxidoreductase
MAGISHNRSNMAARCGLGAVLGSKNIKALVATGQGQIPVYDPQAVKKDREEIVSLINANPVLGILKNGGTAWGLDWLMGVGDTPVKNWEIDSRSEMELCSKINGQSMEGAGLVVGRQNCFMCPIACKRFSKLPNEPAEEKGTVPEYESLGALGTMVIVEDKEAIIKANDLCNMYGMDTISVGGTIAWVIDAYQNGLITKEDTFGLELKWGDGELVNNLIRQIAYRQGFGAILAFGSRKAAEILGKGTEQLTVQVKGLELPMHDPKINPGWGVVYATGSRGASHNETGSIALSNDLQKQAEFIKTSVDRKLFESAINICSYVVSPISDEFLIKIISDITGHSFSIEDIYETGSRIWNQRRIFNAKICNISGKEDTLPKKVMNSNYTEEEFQQNLAAYYRVRNLSTLGEIVLPSSNKKVKN